MVKKSFVKIFCLFFVGLFLVDCATTTQIEIDYPVFKNDKRGRQLQRFLGDTRSIAFWVTVSESAKKNKQVQDFIEQIPSRVYEIFNRESYFKLIDISKREDLFKEMQFAATGLAKSKVKMGESLGVEAFFYMTINNPQIECKEKKSTSTTDTGSKVTTTSSVLSIMIPLDMTLIKVGSTEILKSVSSDIYTYKGTKECPSLLTSFFKTVEKTASKLNKDLSPEVKTADIKIFRGSPNLEVAQLLSDVSDELKGETPNYQSAFKLLEEANRITEGKDWKVLANLGTYYYATRNYKKAVEFYGKAIKKMKKENFITKILLGSDRDYIRDLRKKVMVTFIFKE